MSTTEDMLDALGCNIRETCNKVKSCSLDDIATCIDCRITSLEAQLAAAFAEYRNKITTAREYITNLEAKCKQLQKTDDENYTKALRERDALWVENVSLRRQLFEAEKKIKEAEKELLEDKNGLSSSAAQSVEKKHPLWMRCSRKSRD